MNTRFASLRVLPALIILLLFALGASVVTTGHPFHVRDLRNTYTRALVHLGLRAADWDKDGLQDDLEAAGWRTSTGQVVHTDPYRTDTDADGLPDGVEAGELTSDDGKPAVYAVFSDPTTTDTDADGVDDADELFLDLNPRDADGDEDRLNDAEELACASDPFAKNPDNDSYTDPQECERHSDPLTYDLTHGQAVAALLAGAAFGDATWAAEHLGRLSDAQMQSPEYLAGQIASSFVSVTALRDLIADIGHGELVSALFDVGTLVPVAGASAAIIGVIAKFAKRGEPAERAAMTVVERIPWTKSLREKVIAKTFGAAVELPSELKGGEKTYSVYRSSRGSEEKYIGMTNNTARRFDQHARNGRAFTPVTIMSGLKRGEARAVEEACIVQGGVAGGGKLANKVHTIAPSAPYHDQAVRFGQALLKKQGAKCPA